MVDPVSAYHGRRVNPFLAALTWKLVVGLVVGIALLSGAGWIAWHSLTARDPVKAYEQAPSCGFTEARTQACTALVPATVQGAGFESPKSGGLWTVTVAMPDRSRQLSLPFSGTVKQVVVAGATGEVQVYKGNLTLLVIGGSEFPTTLNPANAQQGLWQVVGFMVFMGLVLLFAVATQLRGRERQR